jgi:hypothetical protein
MMIPREEAHARHRGIKPVAESYPGARERRSKQRITATERWELISEDVYGRVQQRGFVGGDPAEDFAKAASEIDRKYATDVYGLLVLTDPEEMVGQFRNLFAGYGLGRHSLSWLLAMNRESLEALAELNSRLANGRAQRVSRGAPLLQKAVEQAMTKLLSFIVEKPLQGSGDPAAGPESEVVRNTLNRLRGLEKIVARLVENGIYKEPRPVTEISDAAEVHGAVIKAYANCSAGELAQAPVAALKGISPQKAKMLETGLAIHTIEELAGCRPVKLAMAVVAFANAGTGEEASGHYGEPSPSTRSFADIAAGPVQRLEGVSGEQANVLRDVLHIKTVTDLAENRYFLTAGAIVMLAELES